MTLIDDGLILDHAAGTAPAALSVLTLAQAELRPEAARRIALAETTLGALLESEAAAGIDSLMRARVMSRLDSMGSEPEEPRSEHGKLVPKSIADRLQCPENMLKWQRRAGGLSEIPLPALSGDGAEASLIRLEPGRAIPAHDHAGEEYTLVLSGAFSDARARYESGDVCTAGPGDIHRPRVDEAEPCICFAVSLGRMRFKNPLIAAYDRFLTRHS